MVRKQIHFWVVLTCIGAISGLFAPQPVQALGLFGGCCGGGWGWGGCGDCGIGCGDGWWGGGCCGRLRRCKVRCKPRRRWACCGSQVFAGCGMPSYGGCGCGGGSYGADGYATGGYAIPQYDQPYDPSWSPAPGAAGPTPGYGPAPGYGPTPGYGPSRNYGPTPATIPPPNHPGAPLPVPPAPEDSDPAPAPQTSTPPTAVPGRSPNEARRSPFALQNYRTDSISTGVVVYVPEQAKVFVNDRQMKTQGTERRFSGDKLKPGKLYEYDIRAEMVRNGTTLVRTAHVELKAGRLEEVAFDFSDTVAPIQTVMGLFPDTKLTVIVPEDASVYLAGEDTISVGKVRQFVTHDLADGQAWKDYEIRVEYERQGKTVVKSKKISLFAGDVKEVDFNIDAGKKLASSR